MIPLVALPVSPHTMLALLQYMQQADSELSPAEIADEAVLAWLAARRDEAARTARPVLRGYQWKCLFLPEGTRLRIWCRSEHGHAEVVGDQLMYKGRSVSPNQFVAACSDTVRNAWVEISVLMPGETAWKFASVRRREIQAAAARLAQSGRNTLAGQPAAASDTSIAGSLAASSLPARSCAAPSCAAPSCAAPSCAAPSCAAPSCAAPSCAAQSLAATSPAAIPAAPSLAASPAASYSATPCAAAGQQPDDGFAYPVSQEPCDIRRQCPDRRDPRAPLDRREFY